MHWLNRYLLGFALIWTTSGDGLWAQALVVTNGVRVFPALTNTMVTLGGYGEVRVEAASNPLPGSEIHLDSADAFFVFLNVRPSVVAAQYLGQFRILQEPAVADGNCRVVTYGGAGTIVMAHRPSLQPLQIFDGPNGSGMSLRLGQQAYYRGAGLGPWNGRIRSFRLQRGYMATLAQTEEGGGLSRNFVAQDADLEVSLLPAGLENSVRYVYVAPWRWPGKKGIAGNIEAGLRVGWKYNWNIDQNSTRDLEYVPIRQTRWWPDLAGQNWRVRGASHLLGYNEPDHADQANMTVADALASWPDLLGTGLRVGAPAVSDGGRAGWLYPFMAQAEAAGLRVDFVPVHYYWCFNPADPAGAANQMYNFLKEVYDTTRRPIWVTEWNNGANWTGCADPSFSQQQACVAAMIDMLETTPWVERYACYNWVEDVRRLVWDDGSLTAAGTTYRDKVSYLAYVQAAPDAGTRSYAQLCFEGSTLDTSGFGNHGVASGSPAFAPGHRGQALVFDGTNTAVTLPPNVARGSGFTFAAWVYWKGGAAWQRLFDFGNSTTQYLFLTPNSGSGTLRFAIKNGGVEQIVETPSLAPNQWRHVAVTLSGTTARLYVNGAQVAVNTGVSILPSHFNPRLNFLGKSQWPDPLFGGMLDEVLITDFALTSAQIAALPANAPPTFTNSLLPAIEAQPGISYSGSLAGAAADPQGEPLTYSKVTGPSWLTVWPNGTLSGQPQGSDAGTNACTVRVADGQAMSGLATLPVVVGSPVADGAALLARYGLDGNPNDASGHTLNAQAIGAPGYVAGRFGSALRLQGSGQCLTLPAAAWWGVSNFTFAAWVYWDGGSAWQRIFDFGNGTMQYFHLTPSSGNGTLRFAITTNSWPNNAEQIVEAPALPAGQWQHVAVTLAGNRLNIFQNGIVVASGTTRLSPGDVRPTLNYLGRSQYSGDPYFQGKLDEVFLFQRALSEAEIARLMLNLPPPSTIPTSLSLARVGGALSLSWPPDYLGSRLEVNTTGWGGPASWLTVPGSTDTNQVWIPLGGSPASVFYRLAYP